jgi:hypothetical protein
MKKLFTLIIIIMAAGILNNTSAQTCVPSHPGYTVVPDSGKLLPNVLDTAIVGVAYQMPITIGTPGHAMGYPVNWIQYSSVTNYLTGNTWLIVDSAGGNFFPHWPLLTWNCASIIGVPTVAGTDSITIFVNANVTIPIIGAYTANNQKAFTLPLIVRLPTDVPGKSKLETTLIESYPNPYQDNTRIGIKTGKTEEATLNIYSNLGQLVYSEAKTTIPGENYFDFNGSLLSSGTYLYSVITAEKTFNNKLIKTE